jgi:uncharacterized protein with NRDE domain
VCTLAIHFRVSEELPLLVAANRDEILSRPTAGPRMISCHPWVVGGQDLSAGGTWLGLNQHGMVAGVLNRRRAEPPDPQRRSRGLLCLEVLQTRSPEEAAHLLGRSCGADYNGFNLLVATAESAFLASNEGDRLGLTPLSPGVHLLTNLDLNDRTCPRIAKSHRLFQAVDLRGGAEGFTETLLRLRAILSDHGTALDPRATPSETLCVHRPGYGTRSSAIIAHFAAARRTRFWFAGGPPCRFPYAEIALPG